MIQRYTIWHLIVLTTFVALLLATLPWSRPVVQTLILISIWAATQVLIGWRLNCFQAVFPGVVSALIAAVFLSELTGDVPLGSRWLEFEFHPVPIIQFVGMTIVGWFAQFQYVQVRRRQARAFHCSEEGCIVRTPREQPAEQ